MEGLQSDPLFQIGVGVLVATLSVTMIEKVFAFITGIMSAKKGGGEGGPCPAAIQTELGKLTDGQKHLEKLVGDLHSWHDIQDPRTGTRVWYSTYGTTTLQETLDRLSETLRTVADVLRTVVEQQKEERANIAVVRAQQVQDRSILDAIKESVAQIRKPA